MDLKKLIKTSYSSAAVRERGATLIHHHPKYFTPLLRLASTAEDKRENILAAWILEKYALNHLEDIDSELNFFLNGALVQKNDSKRRPFSKLLYHYCKNKTKIEILSLQQIDLIVEICFSYILESQKTAPLAFALKTLHIFRNHKPWITEELQAFIEKKLPNSSPGLKSVVKQIL